MSKKQKTVAFVEVNPGKKSLGHTAKAKLSYVLREGAFRNKCGLVATGKGHLPSNYENHHQYWQLADEHERANSVVFREFMIDLPDHLPMPAVIEMADKMAPEISKNHDNNALLTYQYAIHADPENGFGRHMHLIVSEREQDSIERSQELFFKRQNKEEPAKGGAPKQTNTASALKKRTDLVKRYVEATINSALERFNIAMRVDIDINKKDGKQAQIKLSKRDWQTLQAYKLDDKVVINKAIERFIEIDEYNKWINDLIAERAALDAEIQELEQSLAQPQPTPAPEPDDELDFSLSNADLLKQIEELYRKEDEAAAKAKAEAEKLASTPAPSNQGPSF